MFKMGGVSRDDRTHEKPFYINTIIPYLLNPLELAIYCLFVNHSRNGTILVRFSNSEMCKLYHKRRETVVQSVQKLCELRLISCVSKNDRVYKILSVDIEHLLETTGFNPDYGYIYNTYHNGREVMISVATETICKNDIQKQRIRNAT